MESLWIFLLFFFCLLATYPLLRILNSAFIGSTPCCLADNPHLAQSWHALSEIFRRSSNPLGIDSDLPATMLWTKMWEYPFLMVASFPEIAPLCWGKLFKPNVRSQPAFPTPLLQPDCLLPELSLRFQSCLSRTRTFDIGGYAFLGLCVKFTIRDAFWNLVVPSPFPVKNLKRSLGSPTHS